jgi:hypothetical protein
LCAELAAKYPLTKPVVECGGIPDPTIAAYDKTIDAMAKLRVDSWGDVPPESIRAEDVRAAQMCRYLQIHRPLSFLDEAYAMEDPATGGLPLERLSEKYRPDAGTGIGTAILLSVLEHVADPFVAIDSLRLAMTTGGIAIVSVPFSFPFHAECGEDNFRFTPTGLKHVFTAPKGEAAQWDILECDWRLDIPAEAGVLDIKTGRAQAIKSCYLVARAC